MSREAKIVLTFPSGAASDPKRNLPGYYANDSTTPISHQFSMRVD
jgi:hypothetical protein